VQQSFFASVILYWEAILTKPFYEDLQLLLVLWFLPFYILFTDIPTQSIKKGVFVHGEEVISDTQMVVFIGLIFTVYCFIQLST
jgi:hypothetical protein